MMEEFAGTEQSPESAESLREVTASMGELMRRAYPGMLVVVCAVLQLVTVAVLALVVRPKGLPGPPFARCRITSYNVCYTKLLRKSSTIFANGKTLF